MTTIFDVARRARVSITTVSHVLSGNRRVAASTREQVLAVVAAMGYAPNPTGQGLARGRTNTVAILLPNPLDQCLVNPYYNELLLTVTGEVSARARSAVVLGVGGPSISDGLREALAGRTADGVLWVDPPAKAEAVTELIRQSRVPVVAAGTAPPRTSVTQVRNDRLLVAHLALEHLLGCGYRAIAVLVGSRHLMVAPAFAQAFRATLAELDSSARLDVVYAEGSSIKDGRLAMEALLRRKRVPSAVVGIGESIAVGALHAAAANGVAVPGDLAIVSVGDSHLTSQFTPSVTAVDLHIGEQARVLVGSLFDLVSGAPAPLSPLLISAHLMVRETTTTTYVD